MEQDIKVIICEFVDHLLPDLTPYEASLYLYLLRNSVLHNGSPEIRVGKRTMAVGYGTGSRGVKTNYAHITKIIKGLEAKECIRIGDTNREGTLYIINLPRDIPIVAEKIAGFAAQDQEEDYFTDPEKRRIVFERDKWICQYCGEGVTTKNITIDHYIPQKDGGGHNKENLRTSCLVCNGIKSGKPYEEAAPLLLKSIQERKARSQS